MIHRKPTRRNRYLDFNANNPITHKVSVIKSLVDRTSTSSTLNSHHNSDRKYISASYTKGVSEKKEFVR